MNATSAPAAIDRDVLNVAAYHFASLTNLQAHRDRLKRFCFERQLKGTILLSPEGINLFVAGDAANIEQLLQHLRTIEGLESLEVKESFTSHQPFHRMLVKIKKEIIAFGIETVRPAEYTSRKIPAKELKQWLDEKRPVRLLDVRNDYEIDLGTFHGAEDLKLKHFRHFPEVVKTWETDPKTPVVMFCTGGIRCEKAGPYMEALGFRNIFQLDGGILKYFEECGGDHYDGDCFVFDQRVAVGPDLKPSGVLMCFACQAALNPEDTEDPRYEIGVSCPKCFQEPEVRRSAEREAREIRLVQHAQRLPGSQSHWSKRLIHVPRRLANQALREFLVSYQPAIDPTIWDQAIATGRLRFRGEPVPSSRQVKEGETFEHWEPAVVEPPVATDIQIVEEHEEWIIVDKPAPLPVHASGRFALNTLEAFLANAYSPEKIRLVHRLDANTTGLMLIARRYRAAQNWQRTFLSGGVQRIYWARIHGEPRDADFSVTAPIAKRPTLSGARIVDPSGWDAQTDFRVLHRYGDGTSLVEAIPKTGRTNQIRVHLWHAGMPIVGDPLYLPGHQLGTKGTLAVDQPPMCLHAQLLQIAEWEGKPSRTFRSTRRLSWLDGISPCEEPGAV